MRNALVNLSVLVVAALAVEAAHAAPTPAVTCRKAVSKSVAQLYQETLKGTQSCFKARIASGGSTNCLDASQFDPKGKIVNITSALVTTMSPGGACGTLGTQFAPSCTTPPPVCASACASCGTGAGVAACLACRLVDATTAQVAALYGTPPDLSANGAARTCQNTLGSETAKYGKARMKEQQKCQQDVDANKLRAQCASADRKGKIAKAKAKAIAKVVGKCLTSPGVDQIPALDAAASCLTGGTATSTAPCAMASADDATDAIFALVSQPAFISGFVMTAGPDGALIPLPGVRVEVAGTGIGTITGRSGAYTLRGIPSGTQSVIVDGQRVGNYPRIAMGVPIGMVGETPMGIFAMPEIDMAHAVDVDAVTTVNPDGSRTLTAPVTLDNPSIPGAKLDLPLGTVVSLDVPNRAPLLTVSMVPNNVMPFPSGVFSTQIFSFQPEGTIVSPAASATFPNPTALPDGSSLDVYLPDFANNTFILAGTGTVTTGGTLVETDGPVINSFDWHLVAPPSGCLTDVIGRVVDGTTTPIAGATVLAVGASAISQADGTFTMNGLPCPGALVASAAVVTVAGTVLVGQSNVTIPVFFGMTDVGDIVVAVVACGDGITAGSEECDDGNQTPGDGCSPICIEEQCGNGIVDPGEECDTTAGCSDLCTLCGNGFVRVGEECDLGVLNGTAGSGCTATCRISICGNGVIEEGEQCDDGPANGGEFCDDVCRISALAADLDVSAVRTTTGCQEPGGLTANDEWNGVPTCSPPEYLSTFSFGPNGTGSFTASFADGAAEALLGASFEDVRDAGDVQITDATGWQLRATVRISLANASTSATLSDIVVTSPASLVSPGKLTASIPVAASSGVDFASYAAHNVEIVAMTLVDPTGASFATQGFLDDQLPAIAVDKPAEATGGAIAIVPAYVSCGGVFGETPNASVDGIPSCAPRETFTERSGSPASGWRFDADTAITIVGHVQSSDLKLLASGTGIRNNAGNLATGNGHLRVGLRLVFNDAGTDMTVIDFYASFTVPVTGGAFSLQTASVNGFFTSLGFPPPPSTEGMILGGTIRDPNGDVFATIGTGDVP